MNKLLYFILFFTLNSINLLAQTVSCSRGEPSTTLTVTILNSTPNGTNFDYHLIVEISNGLPESYEITYNGTGTLNSTPLILDSTNGPTAATVTNVPNGTMGTFTATLVLEGKNCTTNPLTFNSVALPQNIPSLSEWGLVVLALSFMTLGTLYLIQPTVQHRLEKTQN